MFVIIVIVIVIVIIIFIFIVVVVVTSIIIIINNEISRLPNKLFDKMIQNFYRFSLIFGITKNVEINRERTVRRFPRVDIAAYILGSNFYGS